MKKVKELNVTVSYNVGLGDLEIPDEVYEELIEASENGDAVSVDYMKYQEAYEWLSDNIRERDCTDWECEVDDIS